MQEGDLELVDICLVLVCMNSKMMKGECLGHHY